MVDSVLVKCPVRTLQVIHVCRAEHKDEMEQVIQGEYPMISLYKSDFWPILECPIACRTPILAISAVSFYNCLKESV